MQKIEGKWICKVCGVIPKEKIKVTPQHGKVIIHSTIHDGCGGSVVWQTTLMLDENDIKEKNERN